MEYALLVPIVASLLSKQHPQLQKPLLIAHAQPTPTQPPEIMPVMGAQLVLVAILLTVPVLLAALQLISACAQPTPMEMMRMEIVLLVQMVVPLLLKRKAEEPPQSLIARVWPTRTAARRRACFVMVRVSVMLTADRLRIASAQPTPMPHLEPMTILEPVQLVPVLVLNASVLLAVLPLRLACAQPTTMEPLTMLPRA